MRALQRWIAPLLAGLLVIALGAALLRGSGNDGGPLVGKPAPDFELETLSGGTVRLSKLRGRPVVVNFWASWCVPCREEAPILRDLAEQQSAAGLAVVGILFQDQAQKARAFQEEYALAFPSLLDPGSNTAIDFGLSGVPETFLIDRDGVVRAHIRGGITREGLRKELPKIGVKL